VAVDRSQIVFTYAGIRPLPHHDDEAPGFVSRDYRIEKGSLGGSPLLSLVGGKWTTFRALGEHMTNEVLALLKRERTASTITLAIGGGVGFPTSESTRNDWIQSHAVGVGRSRAAELLTRYGTKATEFISAITSGHDVALRTTLLYTTAELDHLVRTESVVHLEDVLLRRTDLAFLGAVTGPMIEELADVVGASLGWTNEQRSAEIVAARETLTTMHGQVFTDQPAEVKG
jgi:glycerol-3-phosphate dehydrogenase